MASAPGSTTPKLVAGLPAAQPVLAMFVALGTVTVTTVDEVAALPIDAVAAPSASRIAHTLAGERNRARAPRAGRSMD